MSNAALERKLLRDAWLARSQIRLVLGRLITLQRPEIATLKAIGYSDREVGQHYAGLCVLVLVPGAALGLLAGYGLGHVILGMYARSFRLPQLELQLSASLVGTALGMSLLGAASGALLAVRAAVRLPPAEAMRPASPARYRRGLLERAGPSWWLGPSAMMVAREVLRRPLKTDVGAGHRGRDQPARARPLRLGLDAELLLPAPSRASNDKIGAAAPSSRASSSGGAATRTSKCCGG